MFLLPLSPGASDHSVSAALRTADGHGPGRDPPALPERWLEAPGLEPGDRGLRDGVTVTSTPFLHLWSGDILPQSLSWESVGPCGKECHGPQRATPRSCLSNGLGGRILGPSLGFWLFMKHSVCSLQQQCDGAAVGFHPLETRHREGV